jgi:hypothetical protein
LESSEQHGCYSWWLIFDEVGMRSLGTIKPVGIFVSPISWCVRSRIWAFRLLAVIAGVDGMVAIEKEGRGRGEKHPSANSLVTLFLWGRAPTYPYAGSMVMVVIFAEDLWIQLIEKWRTGKKEIERRRL